jgi:hypothetical protein
MESDINYVGKYAAPPGPVVSKFNLIRSEFSHVLQEAK